MGWRDTVFLSWRMQPGTLRPLVPATQEVDLFDGSAWLSVVAFEMHGKRSFGIPLAAKRFPELNVRTYVRRKGKPGIRFLSMDTPGRLVGFVGRRMGLPYRVADLRFGAEVQDPVPGEATLSFRWRAGTGKEGDALDRFLVERYVAFNGKRGWPRLHVHHAPWPLNEAALETFEPGFLAPLVGLRRPDRVTASPGVDAAAWLR